MGKGIMRIINKILYKVKFNYIKLYYYIYYKPLKGKIEEILKFNEISIELYEEQEEQALPGFEKYQKSGWYKYMLGRYLFAVPHIKNKKVLDTGCGLGWGSYLISDYPESLVSIDIDAKSLQFARKTWKDSRLNFKTKSVLEMSDYANSFDVVLSYEVIEHLRYDDGKTYIEQVSATLHDNGTLIMSSAFPLENEVAEKLEEQNIYHLHIYTKDEISSMLNFYGFRSIRFYGEFMLIAKK
jgi:2-polyprenyl-3-methyl-5-hydroxy-6-metoxy-1,4-benzoquinol methylase